jgi:hypothetical protein
VIELLLEAERALSMGRADRAEQLYEQVVTSDPRNSIAVVGLARVALERADDAGALVLARRALTIDPENDAARRLVQRLEEVLLARGEALPVEAADAGPEPPVAQGAIASPGPATAAARWDEAVRASTVTPPAVEPAVDPAAADAISVIPAAVEPAVDPGAGTAAEAVVSPPAAERATPFDGPDPVLGKAPVDVRPHAGGPQPVQSGLPVQPGQPGKPVQSGQPGKPIQPVQPKERRSLLDRIRGR